MDAFPIGQTLAGINIQENHDFESSGLNLEEVRLIFGEKVIVLRSLPDTDEIEITQESFDGHKLSKNPEWAPSLVGQKLQIVWQCENAQGYLDQVIFAFGNLHPSISFVSEGSVLKVFRFQQVKPEKPEKVLVGSNGSKKK